MLTALKVVLRLVEKLQQGKDTVSVSPVGEQGEGGISTVVENVDVLRTEEMCMIINLLKELAARNDHEWGGADGAVQVQTTILQVIQRITVLEVHM